jgi:recombinational DNA repair protein RecR
MQHITGISRQQLQISSLEDRISPGNPVRFIDAFSRTRKGNCATAKHITKTKI